MLEFLEEEVFGTDSSLSSFNFLQGGVSASWFVVFGVADTVIMPAVNCFSRCGDDVAAFDEGVKLLGG